MSGGRTAGMTPAQLTAVLAERFLGWRCTPDRFLTGARGWIPQWKFQPANKLTDATRLLEAAKPEAYSVVAGANGSFCARVCVAGAAAEAYASTKPLAICLALAKVIGIDVSQ